MGAFTKINIWLFDILNNFIYKYYDLYLNRHVQKQIKNFCEIPVIIINYNQLFYLRKLIVFLEERNFKNIIIVDNNSSYQPLLDYYEEIKTRITIEVMSENFGHLVYFENSELQRKYGKGFYIVTDADIVPNPSLPADFLECLFSHLKENWKNITKTGFALKIDDIPDQNVYKNKVLNWEAKFWQDKVAENIYSAPIDTTFALYKPSYPRRYNNIHFFLGHRFGGAFTAKHGGWYINQSKLTDEQDYYAKTASSASSWLQEDKNI